MKLAVRDLERSDISHIESYLFESPPEFLLAMGIDPARVPSREDLRKGYLDNLAQADRKKSFCPLIWVKDDLPIGFSTLKRIRYGVDGDVHLHIWKSENRGHGLGAVFFAHSVQQFFERFELKEIYCEPSVDNRASNGVMAKLGFPITKCYRTVPSEICREIEVNRHNLTPSLARAAVAKFPLV